MSNEILISLTVQVRKGYLYYAFSPGQASYDLTTERRGGHTQTIGTSEEALDLGDVATPGLCILRNLDDTNYVTIGPQVSTGSIEPMIVLEAGRFALFWLEPTAILLAQANINPVDLQVDVFEV